jgi:geranylgeranyl diphosphate synthase type I
VAEYKSGRYTVQRPLELGAVFAGRPDLVGPYTAFGRPLGAAFQLRDDLLGVVGDPACTGKPVGSDLRDGKPTLLLAFAVRLADGRGRRRLARVGAADLDDREIAGIRAVIEASGAVAAVEREIDDLVTEAAIALDRCDLRPPAGDALRRLCALAAWRPR